MKKYRGFTLAELLVVVAIIGILTAIMTANFTSARARSRDAKRISDVANLQLALGVYFDRCGQYPNTTLATSTADGCPSGITLGSFISKIPTPPTPGQAAYLYKNNYDGITVTTASDYLLGIQLEGNTDSLKDNPSALYGMPCSQATFYYCVGPK